MLSVLVAVSPPLVSVEVAVTVSMKEERAVGRGVIARLASCPGVSVQEPPRYSLPADRVARVVVREVEIMRVAEPAGALTADVLDCLIAAASACDASGTDIAG